MSNISSAYRRITWLVAWLLSVSTLPGQDAAKPRTSKQVVESLVKPWQENCQVPGVLVIVRCEGRTEFFTFGFANRERKIPVTEDSIFELASVTKVFTTTALAMEVEQGRMNLDDPVEKYLPALRNGADIRQVTLKQLATHSSSLPREAQGQHRGPWNRKLVMDFLEHWHAPFPVGSKSLYSNLGVGVLGFAIAAHEKENLPVVFQRQYLDPLGMKSTFFDIPEPASHRLVQAYNPAGHPVPRSPVADGWPAGGRLCSSGRDMGIFLEANLGEVSGHPLISRAMQLAQKPYFKASDTMMQGLAWQRTNPRGELLIDKNGSLQGTSTFIGMLPGRKLGVVVLANRGKVQATMLGRSILFQLAGITPEKGKMDGEEETDASEPGHTGR